MQQQIIDPYMGYMYMPYRMNMQQELLPHQGDQQHALMHQYIDRYEKKIQYYRKWIESMHKVVVKDQPGLLNMTQQIYVGGLPQCTQLELKDFFNTVMQQCGGSLGEGNCVVFCRIQNQGHYAWVNFRSVEEASSALVLDGIIFKGHTLCVRRPNTYDVKKAIIMGPTRPDPTIDTSCLSLSQNDHGNSMFEANKTVGIKGLPLDWNYFHTKSFMSSYGTIEQFRLVTDRITRSSRGLAYCQYKTEEEAERVVQLLNGTKINGSDINVVKQRQKSTKEPAHANKPPMQ